ncbi:MAG: presenilin family intramembrane aspartyl protease [Dehalococcoidales bacterium]|nr:presenilin family intramembrane aspartyl protease [Dehalococcoidales bacterium]
MKFRLSPYLWSVGIMAAALAFSLFVANYNQPAMAEAQIPYQATPLWLILTYFFSAVVVIALVLFFLPMKYLKYVFRVVFAIMFAWGVLVVTFFHLPDAASYTLAALAGLAWIFFARIWLHNLLLLVALAAAASVFGFVFSPWTFMIFMLVVSVYDVLSVRFGLMVWMADKLSNTVSLPAFVFPKNVADVRLNLQSVQVGELKNVSAEKREHTILGGGDIGFPLMLANSVYFAHGMNAAILTGAFAIVGLVGAFLMQKFLYKGKPVPALPPIAIMSLIGFLIGSNYLV